MDARSGAIEGNYADAERAARTSFAEIKESQANTGNQDTVRAGNLLGWQLLVQARFEEAGEVFRSTLRDARALSETKESTSTDLVEAVLALSWKDEKDTPPAYEAARLLNLSGLWFSLGNRKRAGEAAKQAEARGRALLPAPHPFLAVLIRNHSFYAFLAGDLERAKDGLRSAFEMQEQVLGESNPYLGASLRARAIVARRRGEDEEAEGFYQRAIVIEGQFDEKHPARNATLRDYAVFLRGRNRLEEAEQHMLQSLAGEQARLGPDHPALAVQLANLASLLRQFGRFSEAERLLRRALVIREYSLGPDHPRTASILASLGTLYREQARYERGEDLLRRARKIQLARLRDDHPRLAVTTTALALLLEENEQYDEAEMLYREVLAARNKRYGDDHPVTASALANLAGALRFQGKLIEAEKLQRQALAITEAKRGPDHTQTAIMLSNLGGILRDGERFAEGRKLYARALSITISHYGEDHPQTARIRHNQAKLERQAGNLDKALDHIRHASKILERRQALLARRTSGGAARAERKSMRQNFADHADIIRLRHALTGRAIRIEAGLAAGRSGAAEMNEALTSIQRGQSLEAATALARMMARFAVGDDDLARLARNREQALAEFERLDNEIIAAAARPVRDRDPAMEKEMRAQLREADRRIISIGREILKKFPKFHELADPAPLEITQLRALLGKDEALLAILPAKRFSLVFAIGPGGAMLHRTTLDAKQIERLVRRLRSRLDPGGLTQDAQLFELDLGASASLYTALIKPVEPVLGDAGHLLVVPEGALASLPFSLLLKTPPSVLPASFEDYRSLDWLIRTQAISILPSIPVLRALRQFPGKQDASKRFLGVGDPVLAKHPSGLRSAACDRGANKGPADFVFTEAEADETSPDQTRGASSSGSQSGGFLILDEEEGGKDGDKNLDQVLEWGRQRSAGPRLSSLYAGSGGGADACAVAQLASLPETANELRQMAGSLRGGDKSEADADADADALILGEAAHEKQVRALSLGSYRIIAFATHALVTGEIEGAAEPALVLTPPDSASNADDGLLSASEIAQLELNADWVILSACNTAAPDGTPGAGALSGLAQAFFHAGGRSVFVSHWAVVSTSTAQLTTSMLQELEHEPMIGRARAHQRAILSLIAQKEHPAWAHPLFWAPFVVVGEGGLAR